MCVDNTLIGQSNSLTISIFMTELLMSLLAMGWVSTIAI
jgi:hypothetical protein